MALDAGNPCRHDDEIFKPPANASGFAASGIGQQQGKFTWV
jgi:hypothetical protein